MSRTFPKFDAPISIDTVSGVNTEYDSRYLELQRLAEGKPEQQYGDTIIDAEEPDWSTQKELREPMLEVFPAALLGRIQVIPYYPLADHTLIKIVELQLQRIVKRIKDNHGIDLKYSDKLLTLITSRCQEVESGGRMIDSILTNTVLPEISKKLLTHIINNEQINSIELTVENKDIQYKYS